MIFKNFLILNLFFLTNSLNEETILRNDITTSYNKYVRPVYNFADSLEIRMGLAVQNIEEFDQKKETMDLNVWLRMNWKDHLLTWNSSNYNVTFLSMNVDNIWTPDVELLNAASKPNIYILNQALNLYNDGSIFRSKPGIFKFACSLDLHEFPFDIQTCTMKFGSWTYNNDLMNVLPYEDINKQIDVLSTFSHSEWGINRYSLRNYNESRLCCPGKNFSINEYTFELQRYPHYYKLSMWMTISLVIVSFIIMLMKPDNVSRTGTAVFIPLTILALQLTIADKIPVVGYYTLMDNFFLCCFITSMFVSIESGLIFSLITTKSNLIYSTFCNVFNIELLHRKYILSIINNKAKREKHDIFIRRLQESNYDKSNDFIEESDFESTIDVLNNIRNTQESQENINININQNKNHNLSQNCFDLENKENLINSRTINNKKVSDLKPNNFDIDINVVDKNIIRVINFDNENLSLSLKQKLVFDRIIEIFTFADNICRVLLPLIFVIYISYIMSHEK